jgi:hypothetical protein
MKPLIFIGVFILFIVLLQVLFPRRRSSYRRWVGNRTTAYRPIFSPQAGQAVIIGESGAWLNLCKRLRAKGLPINRPADARLLLEQLRSGQKAAIDEFHTEIVGYIRHINDKIAALRAQRGILAALFNWFHIWTFGNDIASLYELERRYAYILKEKIAALEAMYKSPEYAGARAELEVIMMLRGLPGNYVVINNLQLKARRFIRYEGVPLQSAQIDHLVLSPAGIFVIETKRWSEGFTRSGSYHNPFDQVQRARYLCVDLLKPHFGKLPVRSIILTEGALPPAPPDSFVKVLHLTDLNGYITWFKQRELEPEQQAAIRAFLQERVAEIDLPLVPAEDPEPADLLDSNLLRDLQAEMLAAGKPEAYQRRAVLIPTEQPPLNTPKDLKYIPPSLRAEFEKK